MNGGSNTLFWLENWAGCGAFADRFPALYALEKKKSCVIAERISGCSLIGSWKKKPASSEELTELQIMRGVTDSLSMAGGLEFWKSKMSADGNFYVHDFRALIDSKLTVPLYNPTVWLKLVPIKVTIFVWRTCIDRIPSAMALVQRGINVPNKACQFCVAENEETDHFLVGCPVTEEALRWIFNWCGIPWQRFQSVGELVKFAAVWGNCPKKRKILLAILYGFLWCVWNARNDLLFNKTRSSPMNMADNVITTVFWWVKHRGNYVNCNWANWVSFPFNIM